MPIQIAADRTAAYGETRQCRGRNYALLTGRTKLEFGTVERKQSVDPAVALCIDRRFIFFAQTRRAACALYKNPAFDTPICQIIDLLIRGDDMRAAGRYWIIGVLDNGCHDIAGHTVVKYDHDQSPIFLNMYCRVFAEYGVVITTGVLGAKNDVELP